ncbi:MAG: AraC family transcriptional regulator [Solobacterium sp.]|nr:AraC family transcriptional regulator [Solobacterium sp.]
MLVKNSIAQGNSPTKACVKYGFKDYSSFYRAFKKEYGYSPPEESRKLE